MNHACAVTWRFSGAGLLQATPLRPWKHSLTEFLRHWNGRSRLIRTLNYSSSSPQIDPAPHFSATSNIYWSLIRTSHRQQLPSAKASRSYLGGAYSLKKCYSTSRNIAQNLGERERSLANVNIENLSERDIRVLFEDQTSAEQGNSLLQALQEQRAAGTLDHGVEHDWATPNHISNALQYLRTYYPLDEEAAIINRIQFEEEGSRGVQNEILERAERLGIYHPQQPAKKLGLHGISQFEELRKRNEAAWEAELKAKEEDVAKDSATAPAMKSDDSQKALTKDLEIWVEKHAKRAKLSDIPEPPKMSIAQRLVPSYLFVAVAISASILFAIYYQPPSHTARLFPDVPPAATTILAIGAVNVIGFLAWRFPPLWRWMNTYAMLVVGIPKAASTLGNVFSHQTTLHLLSNMVVLWFIGTKLHDEIGRGNFIALYLSSGMFASVASLTRSVVANNLISASLGASGAVSAIVSCYLLFHSQDKLYFIFWPWEERPAIRGDWLLGMLLSLEMFSLWRNGLTAKLDHFSHLAGMVAGAIAYYALKSNPSEKESRDKGWTELKPTRKNL